MFPPRSLLALSLVLLAVGIINLVGIRWTQRQLKRHFPQNEFPSHLPVSWLTTRFHRFISFLALALGLLGLLWFWCGVVRQ